MRILYFSRDYTTHDHRFLTELAGTQNQVYYLRLENRGQPLEDRPLPQEITQVRWAGGKGPAQFRDGIRLLTGLKRVIRKTQPDLIHAGPVQKSGFLTALSGFRPLVTMSWGSDLLRDADRNAIWRWATTFTLRRSAVLVGDCTPVKQKAIDLGFPAERIVTFPWGVDLDHFYPQRTKGEISLRDRKGWHDSFVLLSTRAWEPVYGVDLLARAFVQAAQSDPRLRLVMLGMGSLAPLLRQIFMQGGVQDQVYFGGQVSQRELPQYFRMADLYVSASRSDGSSISLLEALACGTAVVVSDIPGNREWVTPGEQGWWFKDGDEDALAQSILRAYHQRDRLPAMGRAARALAAKRANWRDNFQALIKAYEIALSPSPPKERPTAGA